MLERPGWKLRLLCCLTLAVTPLASSAGKPAPFAVAGRWSIERSIGSRAGRQGTANTFNGAIQSSNPWLSFSAPMKTVGSVPSTAARPLALAAADFDGDGMADLASGYATASGGLVVVRRGNVDFMFPNSPAAQQRRHDGTFSDQPFLPDIRVFETNAPPEFLGAGDFDGDGHSDLVFATRGGASIFYMSGDGSGAFGQAQEVSVPGTVTTLLSDEVNRVDGLTDVVAAVTNSNGSELLVFESPDGAEHAEPEVISLPSPATAIAIGQLDEDFERDIAVAATREVVIVHGRDRHLTSKTGPRTSIAQPKLTRSSLPFEIRSMAIGDFNGDQQATLALLSDSGAVHFMNPAAPPAGNGIEQQAAGSIWTERRTVAVGMNTDSRFLGVTSLLVRTKTSSLPGDDLAVLDPIGRRVHLLSSEHHDKAGRSAARNSSVSDQPADLDFDSEVLALVPMRLNADALSDLVVLEPSGPTALVTSGSIFTVTNTNDTGPGSLRQAIDSANNAPGADTIAFNIPGNGPFIINSINPRLILTDVATLDATTQPGYAGHPIVELNGSLKVLGGNSTVRGLAFHSPGLFAGQFGEGIILGREPGNTVDPINGNNFVEGCYFGLASDGVTEVQSALVDIVVTGPNNTIGGTTAAARNIISGSRQEGILISTITSVLASGNRVQGNYIGTDVSGTADRGNGKTGVQITGASDNVIGGTSPGAGNLISANGLSGVSLETRSGFPASNNNLIQGNFIGTDKNGTHSLGNKTVGIALRPGTIPTMSIANNLIGGTTPAARNLISGNLFSGVWLSFGEPVSNTVQGNWIGTQADGVSPLPNGVGSPTTFPYLQDGITLDGPGAGTPTSGPSNTVIGGSGSAGNVIGFNVGAGVRVLEAYNTLIQGNSIRSNVQNGVLHARFSQRTVVSQNSIDNNGGLGIDIVTAGPTAGVTPNDHCDTDVFGGNPLLNFPALTFAASGVSTTTVKGSLDSAPNQTFALEFFSSPALDPSGFGEGRTFLGSATATTGANCIADFSAGITLVAVAPIGEYVTATATDSDGNTSKFSQKIAAVLQPNADLAVTATATPIVAVAGDTVTYTITATNNGPQNAAAVTLSDSVPANTTFASITAAAGWSCTTPSVGSAGTIVCTTPALNSGAAATFLVMVKVATGAPAGIITNTATVSNSVTDPNPANNSASATTSVVQAAQLTIEKRGPATIAAGETISYGLTVTNAGGAAASSVSMRDPLPANTSFVSTAQNSGPAFTCTSPAAGSTGTISCSIASLAAGASATFTVVVRVDANASGTISNTGTVAGGNSSTVNTTVMQATDVVITKTGDTFGAQGGVVNYTIQITNNGPVDAQDVTWTDTAPAGTVFLSGRQVSGPTFTCPFVVPGVTSVTCNLALLANGASARFTLTFQLISGALGPLTNTAALTSSTPDRTPGNNTASATTTVLLPMGPIYTSGASYRFDVPPAPLSPIYTQGASYRVDVPPVPISPVYTPGASYRIEVPRPPLSPIYTQGASYAVSTCAADVTSAVTVTRGGFQLNRTTGRYVQQVTLKNVGANAIQGPVSLALDTLSSNASLFNKSGTTTCAPSGRPYIDINVGIDNALVSGESAGIILEFTNTANQGITYSTRVLAGGNVR